MPWTILWSPKALSNLKGLPGQLQTRILGKVDQLQEDPFHFLEHFEGHPLYKLRIGDYRALIELDFENKTLLIRVFDHRKRIYKRLG